MKRVRKPCVIAEMKIKTKYNKVLRRFKYDVQSDEKSLKKLRCPEENSWGQKGCRIT